MEIKIEEKPYGYLYSLKSNIDHADVEIVVETENSCLVGLKLPEMSFVGSCFGGDNNKPCFSEVMRVLNKILQDFNVRTRILSKDALENNLDMLFMSN